MNKEVFREGLRKNWYLLAILALLAAFAAVKLLTASSGDTQAPSGAAAGSPALPPAQQSLETLLDVLQPDEEAKTFAQIDEYQKKIDAEAEAEDTPYYLMAMGNLYQQKLGDYEKASFCYERIIADFPSSNAWRDAFLQLETCYLALEDETKLRRLYKQMIVGFPEDSQEYLYARQKYDAL